MINVSCICVPVLLNLLSLLGKAVLKIVPNSLIIFFISTHARYLLYKYLLELFKICTVSLL